MARPLTIFRILTGSLGLLVGTAMEIFQIGTHSGLAVILTTMVCVAISFLVARRRTRDKVSQELIPGYLHSAFNGLTEGLLVLDYSGRIVFVNDAFLQFSQEDRQALLEQKARDLNWKWVDVVSGGEKQEPVGWLDAVRGGQDRYGQLIGLKNPQEQTFVLRAVAITDGTSSPLGALCSFQNVTKLHKKEAETQTLLRTIRESSSQIRQQNAQLEELVIRDPVSGCLNRRTGFETLDRLWLDALEQREPLSCMLIDIDHFRAINEQLGRKASDKVLLDVGTCLQELCRPADVVCRLGGEEFLILMPRTTLTDGAFLAERVRQSVARLQTADAKVTISLGVAEWEPDQASPQDLIDLAERRLQVAKERGRNQVVKETPAQENTSQSYFIPDESAQTAVIPFPAVTALFSALAYRDLSTASHSRRVADLSVAVGQRLMSSRGCYILETAALLHDIGKVGVPDSLLHKQTALTEEELADIQAHHQMGIEIVRTAFGSPELSAILENVRIPYTTSLEQQHSLPLGTRILAIADAYDSMISDQIYRQALAPSEAMVELERCAGSQFDPEVVAQFIDVISSRSQETFPRLEVNREVALELGLQLERLAEAVDQQDLNLLQLLARQLVRSSSQTDAYEIAERAQELERAVSAGNDQLGILQKANDLLACCRATQMSYLKNHSAISVR
ncbi:MAG TPA: diguanylate cyclase [Planctomicrobium sp.]|nr:diguanylate cyclase [Planctomicrobium sp.]